MQFFNTINAEKGEQVPERTKNIFLLKPCLKWERWISFLNSVHFPYIKLKMFSLLCFGSQGRGQKHFRLLQREQHRTRQQSHQLQKSGRERKGRRGTGALNNRVSARVLCFIMFHNTHFSLSHSLCAKRCFPTRINRQRSLEVRSSHFYSCFIVTNWPVSILSALQSWKWGTSWLTIRSRQMAAFVNPPLFVSLVQFSALVSRGH